MFDININKYIMSSNLSKLEKKLTLILKKSMYQLHQTHTFYTLGLYAVTSILLIALFYHQTHHSHKVRSTKLTSFQQEGVFNVHDLITKCRHLDQHVQQVHYKDVDMEYHVYTVNKYNLSVCVVPKAGCSFLKQLVYFLNDPQDLGQSKILVEKRMHQTEHETLINLLQRQIFDISRQKLHANVDFDPVSISRENFTHADSHYKVTVARNPYSRLYSAYIDKVYIPVLWDYTAYKYKEKHMMQRKRGRLCKAKFETFENFLENIVSDSKTESWGNKHWLPASTLCNPCITRPDFVIRQEHYNQDIEAMLTNIQITSEEWNTIQSVISKQGVHTRSSLKGLIITMFDKGLSSNTKCFSMIQIAQRIWNALQVQGQIYQFLPFPYTKLLQLQQLDSLNVANVFLSEMDTMPITTEESNAQRTRALARAYRNIKPAVLLDIQAMFYYDFVLFGYDFTPPTYICHDN